MEIIKYRNNLDIHKIVMALKNGKVVVLPTDTVYGMCGNGLKKEVYQKIYQIKQRPKQKAFPLFVKDLGMANEIAFINDRQKKFLKNVWPGKVTVILKIKNDSLKKIYGSENIALRQPNHHLIAEIFKLVGFPIIGTSANISGQKSLLNPQEIFETFQKQNFKPDFVLDFKTLPESKSSTIIDITKKQPQIIRQGDVDSKKLLNLWQLND